MVNKRAETGFGPSPGDGAGTDEAKGEGIMASEMLSEPGSEYGPCLDENCGHRDCILTRQMSESICPEYGRRIGYDERFYRSENGYVQALCIE